MIARKLCLLTLLCLSILTLVLPCACSKKTEPAIPGQVIEDMSIEEAFALMEDHWGSDDFVIIDLRDSEAYARGHLEKAINLDPGASDFDRQLDELDREKVYLLYSHADDVSGEVMDVMAGEGFMEVHNMLGGMEHWEEIGLPKVK